MQGMRVVKGSVVGNTVVLEEALPEGAEVGVVAGDADLTNWTLSEKGWALLDEARESIRQGHFVTDEQLQAELDAIDAECVAAHCRCSNVSVCCSPHRASHAVLSYPQRRRSPGGTAIE